MNQVKSLTKLSEAKVADKDVERMRANHAQAIGELQRLVLELQTAVVKLGG